MMISEIVKVASEVAKETSKEVRKLIKNLDKPLNTTEISENVLNGQDVFDSLLKDLDKPLNAEGENGEVSKKDKGTTGGNEVQGKQSGNNMDSNEKKSNGADAKDINKMEKMEPQIEIEFTCPQGVDKKEFTRQLKGQERGLNSQTVAENMANRAAFEQRKRETGNGRDLSESKKAQDIAREKAIQKRIESNQKKGMSYREAKAEAEGWIKTQAALHNPDQIAGGNPGKVSRMGDAGVNSSIGAQWRTRVELLADGVDDFAKGKQQEELQNIKMNVKLVAV